MLHVLSSGSKGNAYCIQTDEEYIFVDMGVTGKLVREFLKGVSNEKEKKRITLLLTHEHTDHISGLPQFIKNHKAKIYTSRGTASELIKKGYPAELLYTLQSEHYYEFDSFAVKPVDISHDAAQPYGFIISTDSAITGIMTDTGCVTRAMLEHLHTVDTLVLESNYDQNMLQTGPYPARLKRRVKSVKGHLSNDEAVQVISALSCGNLLQCFLAHVSENNNDYGLLEQLAAFISNEYNIATGVLRQKQTYSYSLNPFYAKLGN